MKNTTSNARLRLNYPSWTRPRSQWSATGPRDNTQPSEPNSPTHTTENCMACSLCYTYQTDGLRRSDRWHLSDQWTEPVRSVATAVAQQTFQEASVTPLGPGTKTPPKHNLKGRRTFHKVKQNNSKPAKNWPATTQPKDTRIMQITQGKSHKRLTSVGPVSSTGQTGHAWAARDEQHPRVNSPKSNSRSPDSLYGFTQDFGDSRTPQGYSIAKLWSTKTCWIKRNRRISAKNSTNPRTTKTPKLSPFTHGFGRGINGKITMKGSWIYSPPNPKEKVLKTASRKSPRKRSENHQKGKSGRTQTSLEEPRRIIYTYDGGSYKV
jgi:hypothetical protein